MAASIVLTCGAVALVSDDNYESLSAFQWRLNEHGYAVRSATRADLPRRGTVAMHRQIMNAQRGQVVDHANMNVLDNRRDNLRFCTHSQNHANGRNRPAPSGRTSQYKGVAWSREKDCWRAHIVRDGKQSHLGYYHNEIDAAHAYDYHARRMFGEFARVNIEGVDVLPQKIVVRKNNTSGFRGVHRAPGMRRWRAIVQWREGDRHCREAVGLFDSPEEAALAYNAAAIRRFGDKARLNDVENPRIINGKAY